MTGQRDYRRSKTDDPRSVAVISFDRNEATGGDVAEMLRSEYPRVEQLVYADGVFERAFVEFYAVACVMAVGIVVRKVAPLLDSKWTDPVVVAVDDELTWAVPVIGGHHGANDLARDLASLGAVPTVTTASDIAGKQSVESRAAAIDARIETPDSTVATNLAVLEGNLGPVVRIDGPEAILVSDDVTVLKRTQTDGIVLGTGCVSGVEADQCLRAWDSAVEAVGRDFDNVEFVATGRLKADEDGLFEAAATRELGVVVFERDTLAAFEGPTSSRAVELVGWPGIAEASALAGGRQHELAMKKRTYEDAVTVAVGR